MVIAKSLLDLKVNERIGLLAAVQMEADQSGKLQSHLCECVALQGRFLAILIDRESTGAYKP